MTKREAGLAVAVVVGALALAIAPAGGCFTPPTPAQVDRAADHFCAARAAFKALQALSGDELNPEPGSSREQLEQAEDEFCTAHMRKDAAK